VISSNSFLNMSLLPFVLITRHRRPQISQAHPEAESSTVRAGRTPQMPVRALGLLVAVAIATALTACGHASSAGVQAGIKQLASISAEGALMADDLARGRTKTTFVRVHGAELSAQAEHEAEKLNDDPVEPQLKQPIHTAIELSADISGAIDDLRVSPQDREQARESKRKLLHWATEAGKLAEGL
jgi:hypothetical protein